MNNHVTDNSLMYNNLPQNLIPSPKQTSLLSAMNGDSMSPLFPQMFSSETRYPSTSQYPYRANATSSPVTTANVTSPSLGLFSSNTGLDANQNVVNGGLTHMSNNMNMLNNQVTSSMVNSTNGLFTTTTALNDQDLLNHVTYSTPKGMYQNQTSGNALSLTQSTVYSNIGNTYPLLRPGSSLMNSPLGLHDVGSVKLPSGNGVTYTDLTNSTTNINGYAYSPKDDGHNDLSKVSDVMNQIDDLNHARIKLESEAVRSTSPKVWRPY
jgi:hypothetical protein